MNDLFEILAQLSRSVRDANSLNPKNPEEPGQKYEYTRMLVHERNRRPGMKLIEGQEGTIQSVAFYLGCSDASHSDVIQYKIKNRIIITDLGHLTGEICRPGAGRLTLTQLSERELEYIANLLKVPSKELQQLKSLENYLKETDPYYRLGLKNYLKAT